MQVAALDRFWRPASGQAPAPRLRPRARSEALRTLRDRAPADPTSGPRRGRTRLERIAPHCGVPPILRMVAPAPRKNLRIRAFEVVRSFSSVVRIAKA